MPMGCHVTCNFISDKLEQMKEAMSVCLSGVGRELCKDRTLSELLEFAHGSPGSIVTAEHKRDVMNCRMFVTSKVIAVFQAELFTESETDLA